MVITEAQYYEKVREKLHCYLCPHNCLISPGETGICHVRRNVDGKLISENYGLLSSVNFDPVEKKPLYHFYPGKIILSLGSVGCNMHCKCCQNWQISQVSAEDFPFKYSYSPRDILRIAMSRDNNIGVAYTYNEPTVWFEYMVETARLIHQNGLKNVVVSNGYISAAPLAELLTFADAFNIDLKAFSSDIYRKFTGAKLDPVLNTLIQIKESGRHLEITCLVIPGLNDDLADFKKMVSWISSETGKDTVLHLSRYHPMYKLEIESTPPEVLKSLYEEARNKLNYVYIGNININNCQDTICPNCYEVLIKRNGYSVEIRSLTVDGFCKSCGHKVIIT